MVRVPAFSAILLISGLTGATLMTAQANDQLAPPHVPRHVLQQAEKLIGQSSLRRKLRVLESTDGDKWDSVALIAEAGRGR
jgi:hypothetical protein